MDKASCLETSRICCAIAGELIKQQSNRNKNLIFFSIAFSIKLDNNVLIYTLIHITITLF